MRYIDKLIKNCEIAKISSPVKEFNYNSEIDLHGVKHAIYIIEEIEGDTKKTFSDFSQFKDLEKRKEKGRKCARINSPSKIMYVGSSTTGIKKRIKQHMGDGHPGTYAIHLKHWFKGRFKIIIKQYDVTKEALQIIEDDLSDKLKPAFGKQGGNNK